MKYIEEVNRFHMWLASHPDIPTPARLLWFVLMHYNNGCYWKRVFSLSMSSLTAATGLSASSIRRARDVLQEAGRIRYTTRSGKQSTLYEIIPLIGEGMRTASVDNSERGNEELLSNATTMLAKSPDDVIATRSEDEPAILPDNVGDALTDSLQHQSPNACHDVLQGEVQGESQGESQGGCIHRQDKTRLDNTKETTVKKGGAEKGTAKKEPKRCFTPPSVAVVRAYCEERGNGIDPEEFVDFYGSKGWMVGKSKMKDWKCALRNWERRRKEEKNGNQRAKRYARSSTSNTISERSTGTQMRRHTFVYHKGGGTD
ncbi:hypothetical protein [uncultured Veillonella sp.]|uniref:hypothetical protein n=1 Tax=uncultured Veillonella sp. TaxID=159268 RepID=UPI00258B340F|nr:hypothetical protein [uncultured Veillonella sp.]